jgi:hypothetical protein
MNMVEIPAESLPLTSNRSMLFSTAFIFLKTLTLAREGG